MMDGTVRNLELPHRIKTNSTTGALIRDIYGDLRGLELL